MENDQFDTFSNETLNSGSDGMFDHIYIAVGGKSKMFTLRSNCVTYGRGEVVNGVFNGSKYYKSTHIKNLGQDLDSAIGKAKEYASENGMKLVIDRAEIDFTLGKISRKTEEEKEYERTHFTFGKYRGQSVSEVADKDIGYVKWASENLHGKPIHQSLMDACK